MASPHLKNLEHTNVGGRCLGVIMYQYIDYYLDQYIRFLYGQMFSMENLDFINLRK